MKRHALEKFGVRHASPGEIRAEKLEERIAPRVPFPHTHDFYHLVLITHGSGVHEIDFKKHRVQPRALFVMKPGQIHTWTLSPNTKGFVLEFTELSLNRELKKIQESVDFYVFKQEDEFRSGRFSLLADGR